MSANEPSRPRQNPPAAAASSAPYFPPPPTAPIAEDGEHLRDHTERAEPEGAS